MFSTKGTFTVLSEGKLYDAHELAERCVSLWDEFIQRELEPRRLGESEYETCVIIEDQMDSADETLNAHGKISYPDVLRITDEMIAQTQQHWEEQSGRRMSLEEARESI
jgi:hypothetical protein